ncbi:MAG: hypothetical protein ABI321_23875 [Polyangia bacterium]
MTRVLPTLMFTLVASLGSLLAGCGNIDNAVDCNAICDKYKSCYDSNYDTSACYDRCRSNSKDDKFEKSVSDCHDCIGDKSCAGATFTCGAQCGGVVP